MNVRCFETIPLLVTLVVLTGCAGGGISSASLRAIGARQVALREDVRRLDEEIRELRAAQEDFERKLSDKSLTQPLEEEAERCSRSLSALEGRLEALEKSIAGEREAWNRKMQAVLQAVKEENAQLRGAIEKLRTNAVASGWEHTVSRGETLAAIAKAYGVRVKDIVEANELDDPDRISVGETLFIPRPAR